MYSHPHLALHGRPQPEALGAEMFRGSACATTLAPQPLTISLPDGAALDAGTVTLDGDAYHIAPPATPMVDQLLTYLDAKPSQYIGMQSRHMGVGMVALCVRWGSYLATLLDPGAPLHPDVAAGASTRNMSLIDDDEMHRMNLEVSYAIARLAGIYHERGIEGVNDVLTRAYLYLPMPQQAVQMNREAGRTIITAMASAALYAKAHPDRIMTSVPKEHADRVIANILAIQGWRKDTIENIHAGSATPHPLRPHQRRMRTRDASHLLREVGSAFASYYFWFDALFDSASRTPELPHWPETATALAHTFVGNVAHGWSLTDTSATIVLPA